MKKEEIKLIDCLIDLKVESWLNARLERKKDTYLVDKIEEIKKKLEKV